MSELRASSRRALRAPVPRQLPRLGRSTRLGAGASARGCAADRAEPGRARRPRSCDCAPAKQRVDRRIAEHRDRTSSAYRPVVHSAFLATLGVSCRRAQHEPRLAARCDRAERRGLRARLGQQPSRAPIRSSLRPALRRRFGRTGGASCARPSVGPAGADEIAARRASLRTGGARAVAPDADQDTRVDRRGARDGSGDGGDDLAAARAARRHEGGRLRPRRAVARAAVGERSAARRRLLDRGGVRHVRSARVESRACRRRRLSRHRIDRCAGRRSPASR